MIKIVTDSTCDLMPGVAQQHGITVVPMVVNIDGQDLLDGEEITREQFYTNLPAYRDFPKTAANSPATLADAYRAAKIAGAEEVLSVHLPRTLSGACASADVAAGLVRDEGMAVQVLDAGATSLGLGWLAVRAAEMASAGASMADILIALDSQKRRTHVFAMIDTLKYLRKGGRVSAMTATLGDLLQVRLLVKLVNGEVTQIDRVRTRARGIERLIEEARKVQSPFELFSVLHSSGSPEKDFAQIEQGLADLGPKKPDAPTLVTPIIGAHVGPAGLGVAVISKA